MSVHEKQVQQLEASKAESVRIDFRETWLFDMILMNHRYTLGKLNILIRNSIFL